MYKRILSSVLIVLLSVQVAAAGPFVPGQILTAAALNAALDSQANLTSTSRTSFNGILKGNGVNLTVATPGVDYAPITSSTSLLYGNGSGGFSGATFGSGITFIGGVVDIASGAGMVYPGAGIAKSTGSAWATSITAPSGALVGTTDTQTLTNKDLTSGTNTFPTFNQNTTGNAATCTLATAMPYSGLTGTVPTWNQNTTGNAATVTNGLYTTNKDASGGVPGLTLYKLDMRDTTNTYTSYLTNSNTASRTYTLPDKTGTVAMTSDITGINSGTNTGDQTNIAGNAATATLAAATSALATTGTSVDVAGSAPPSGANQILMTTDTTHATWIAAPGGGNLYSANNLSDVASATTARTNLGAAKLAGDTTQAFAASTLNAATSISLNSKMVKSSTAPTISSGCGTGPAIAFANGTAAFRVQVGTGGTATTCTLTMPAAPNFWVCEAHITQTGTMIGNQITDVQQFGATTIVIHHWTMSTGTALAFPASSYIDVQCSAL